MRELFFLCMLAGLISCTGSNSSDNILKFESERKLSGELVVKGELLDYSYLMEEYGEYLILVNFRNNGAIKIIDKSSGRKVFDGVDFGGGPNDIFIPISIYVDKDAGIVYLQDGGSNQFKYFNFDDFDRTGRVNLKSIDIPDTGDRIFPVFPFGDSTFLGVSLDKDKELFLFRESGISDTLFSYEDNLHHWQVPMIIYGLPKDGRYSVDRVNGIIAKGLVREPEVRFFDIGENSSYSYKVVDHKKYVDSFDDVSGRFSFDKARNFYYVSAKSSQDVFYFLFSNTPDEDVDIVLLGSEVHAYDINLRTFTKYILDRPISDFAIDDEKGLIYGLNFTSPDPVVKFRIK